MNEKSSRFWDSALAWLFAAFLATPVLCMFLGLDLRSGAEDEKREPAPFPALSWHAEDVRAFPKKFDAYFQDHFGLRRLFIRGHSLLSFYVLHTSPSPKAIIGKDGWLYYDGLPANDGDPINEFRGNPPLTPYHLERWRWMFQDISDWLQERNIRFLLAIVPAKECIYPEFMPDWLAPVGISANEQIARYFTQHGLFEFLDLKPVLIAAKGGEPLYMKTDTHWTPYGAYIGYSEIMRRLASWYPSLEPWPLSDFHIKKAPYLAGDLAQMMDLRRVMTEDMMDLEPLKPRRAHPHESGDTELADVTADIADTNLPRVVVFRDSFTVSLIPFLSEHFSRVFYKWSRVGMDIKVIQSEKPDLVLQVLSDRILGRGLRYPTEMQIRGAERRFNASTNVLAVVAAVKAVKDAQVDADTNGIVVHTKGYEPTVELPPIADVKRFMPIVRLEMTAPGKTEATITWTSAVPSPVKMEISADLVRGSNTVYLSLMDPEMTGSPRLNVGTQKGDYKIKSIEIRGVPR